MIGYLYDSVAEQHGIEEKYAQERTFFMAELAKSDETRAQLEKRIEDLEQHLQDEKNYNAKLFVNE